MRAKVNGEWVEIDLHPRYSQYGIWYNMRDYREDKLVRFYRQSKGNPKLRRKKGEFYEIPVGLLDFNKSRRQSGKSPNAAPDVRRRVSIKINGKNIHLTCSRLTYYICWGFPDVSVNPERKVVDHIDHNTLNDRPSNLLETTQKENSNTPAHRANTIRNYRKHAEYKSTKDLKKMRSNG